MGQLHAAIQSTFSHKKQLKPVPGVVMDKLRHYENEAGWFVLYRDASIVKTDSGTPVIKVLEDFNLWKQLVPERGFKVAFEEYYPQVVSQI